MNLGVRAGGKPAVVSVVIPCFRQAHFLGEAIESVLRQTYPSFEIIVVDDGSPDNVREVAERYPSVRYIHQHNQGRSAARNAGLRESTAELLVFLDADDRLLPTALETGVNCLAAHPECAFVSGRARVIAADGAPLEREEASGPHSPCAGQDHYLALLRNNYTSMHAVMFRRRALECVAGFDTSLHASEDYDLYLRIARRMPVRCHQTMVAETRKHDTNTTNTALATFPYGLMVIRSQWKYVRGRKDYEEAYRSGLRSYRDRYGFGVAYGVAYDAWIHARRREWKQSVRAMLTILRQPSYAWYAGKKLCWMAFGIRK